MNLDFVKAGLVIKNWKYHLAVFLFCLLITAIYSLVRIGEIKLLEAIDILLILVIQIELFLIVAFRIFRRIETGTDRKEITRTMLSKFALFMIVCFLISLAVMLIFLFTSNVFRGNDPLESLTSFFERDFFGWMKQTTGGLMFGAAIFIFIQWQDALTREQMLREKNLIFQNETLRNQVNPHFLFNSLNTLSALISDNQEAANQFVSKLSSIYRYILENSRKDRISLESELRYIKEYTDLHKIRGEEKMNLTIDVQDADKHEILPVSLQILIENAIKHNKATREAPLAIGVFIEEDYIVVRNNLQKMATRLGSTGTGLRNLADRVKLATGKSLVIEETEKSFIVKVPLI